MFIIRKASINDIPRIIELAKMLLQYDHGFDQSMDIAWHDSGDGKEFIMERINASDGIIFVAEMGSSLDTGQLIVQCPDLTPIGYLIGGIVEPESYRTVKKLAELEEIFVLESYRGQGIGAKLIETFYNWCKEQDAEKVRVTVSAANANTIKLYKKMGLLEYDLVLEKQL